MCVRAEEWLTDDKGALASFLLWTALPVAKEDSSASESSLSTGKVSSDPEIKATESRPTVCMLSKDQQAVIRTGKTQPHVQASQHCSGFPVTLDCTHIHLQHCSSAPTAIPLHCPPPPTPPHPPSYLQSLTKSQFCRSETFSDPPAYTSGPVVTKPPEVMWTVSTGFNTISTQQPAQMLRRVQSFTSTTSASGAPSSIPSATHIYSQKLSRPTSAGQGKLIFPRCSTLAGQNPLVILLIPAFSHLSYDFLFQLIGGAVPVSWSQTQQEPLRSWAPCLHRPSPTSRRSFQPCKIWLTSRSLASLQAPVTSTCWHNTWVL